MYQSLLERQDYNGLKKERDKLGKQVRRIAYIKLSGAAISIEEQELLDTGRKLGKDIQNVEQQAAKEVAKKYPYSGRKGLDKLFEEKTKTKVAEIKREHATWVENRKKKIKEENRIQKELFANEKAKRRREEREFINSLQVQPSNSNSNSNEMNSVTEHLFSANSAAMVFSVVVTPLKLCWEAVFSKKNY